jgi:hypothetical protein
VSCFLGFVVAVYAFRHMYVSLLRVLLVKLAFDMGLVKRRGNLMSESDLGRKEKAGLFNMSISC